MEKIKKLREINEEINIVIRNLQVKCFVLNSDDDLTSKKKTDIIKLS